MGWRGVVDPKLAKDNRTGRRRHNKEGISGQGYIPGRETWLDTKQEGYTIRQEEGGLWIIFFFFKTSLTCCYIYERYATT